MEGSAQRTSRRWRMSREEIASQVLIPGNEWHPLDGTDAPEFVPEAWDGVHVSVRLVEAFTTLTALPIKREFGAIGYWPEIMHDWADMLAQNESDLDVKEETAGAHNRTRLRPSAQDVSRCETAICWPGRYIPEPSLSRLVQKIALARSRKVDMQHVAHRMKLDPKYVRARNRVGLDLIARCLRRDTVRVF